MSDKKPCTKEQLVPQAMRRAIINNRPLIAQLLEMDVGTDTDEFYVELLRLCLFDETEHQNPQCFLEDRPNGGGLPLFQPVRRPDYVPQNNELVNTLLDWVATCAVHWNGNRSAQAIDIVRSIMLTS